MRHGIYLSLVVAALTGCSENTFFKDPEVEEVSTPGSILGRVCDPSGRHWLPDAMAYANLVDDDGRLYDTRIAYTDRDGYFLLNDMPSGKIYDVYVQYGDEILETHEVNIEDGAEAQLEEPPCFDPLELDVAVVTGDYDDFEAVLLRMGFANYEVIDGKIGDEMAGFLTNLDKMLQYDIIVFNGGHVEEGIIYPAPDRGVADEDADGGLVFDEDEDADGDADEGADADDSGIPPEDEEEDSSEEEGDDTGAPDDDTGEVDDGDSDGGEPTEPLDAHETVINNIRNYVASGGSVYASDWAYDVIEQSWPEVIDFVAGGTGGIAEIPNAAQLGRAGPVTARIPDVGLADWLGVDQMQISYDLPVWPPIADVKGDDSVNVHMQGKVEYQIGPTPQQLGSSPLLVSFAAGEGRVAYSTFRIAENADSNIVLTLQYMMYSL